MQTYPLFGLFVCWPVEFIEQEEEHNSVHSNPPHKCSRVVAIDEEKLKCVHHNSNKLDHLQCRQILLPPQIFLILWSHCRKQIICVHHNVDESVQQAEECAMTTCRDSCRGVRRNYYQLRKKRRENNYSSLCDVTLLLFKTTGFRAFFCVFYSSFIVN